MSELKKHHNNEKQTYYDNLDLEYEDILNDKGLLAICKTRLSNTATPTNEKDILMLAEIISNSETYNKLIDNSFDYLLSE